MPKKIGREKLLDRFFNLIRSPTYVLKKYSHPGWPLPLLLHMMEKVIEPVFHFFSQSGLLPAVALLHPDPLCLSPWNYNMWIYAHLGIAKTYDFGV